MPIHSIYGVWTIAFTVLSLSTDGLVSAMRTSLTDHENDMMENGTFVYSTLSAKQKAMLFRDFEKENSRKYASEKDRNGGFKQFQLTLKGLDKLNAPVKVDRGAAVFGINMMADLSPQEFKSRFLGMIVPYESERVLTRTVDVAAFEGESTSVDWSGKLTTPIKFQEGCGTCWAFGAIQQIESDAIKAGLTTPKDILSAQQIFQCTYSEPSCDGGNYLTAFDSVAAAGGVTYNSSYPYDIKARKCDNTKNDYPVTVTAYNKVEGKQKMINHVLNGGTLVVSVDASGFGSYKSGIFSNCPAPSANHAMQIVGVNIDEGYWIIRNSWGDRWGEKGYMKLSLGTNMCLIENYAFYVNVKSTRGPQPSPLLTVIPSIKSRKPLRFRPSRKSTIPKSALSVRFSSSIPRFHPEPVRLEPPPNSTERVPTTSTR